MNLETPIIFTAPLVRAIIAGNKTQTRRVIKPSWLRKRGLDLSKPEDISKALSQQPFGSKLWVRETWQPFWSDLDIPPPKGLKSPEGWTVGYVASDGVQEWVDHETDSVKTTCKPAIHMPKWASRLVLPITSVRIQRLQDITEDEAMEEGMTYCGHTLQDIETGETFGVGYRTDFVKVWQSLYGNKYPWAENPYVWVVGFSL